MAKQAVILIHGVGEQRPMDTLRSFVDAVWTRDTAIHDPHAVKGAHTLLWSKPDRVSNGFELRRLTTPQNTAGVTTDFFEFYWAHLMSGTSYGHVVAWARTLLLRRPSTVPAQLRPVYWLLILLALAAAAFGVYAVASGVGAAPSPMPPWVSALISLAIVPLAGLIVKNVVGDAARYLHVAPTNVQRRNEIRQAGVDLLLELHQRRYQRIIVVGHSLGSVIGYDVLTHAWVDFHKQVAENAPSSTAGLDVLESMAAHGFGLDTKDVQTAQRNYFNELVGNGNTWRVTDFVTLGSPLAHGSILLSHDETELGTKQEAREFPTCLPVLETLTRNRQEVRRFSFELPPRGTRVPHHAAVFAPTRWTNLYFPNRYILKGDLIGGPIAPYFGSAVQDVAVQTSQRGGFLSHTLYWRYNPTRGAVPSHIRALRTALNLAEQPRAATASA